MSFGVTLCVWCSPSNSWGGWARSVARLRPYRRGCRPCRPVAGTEAGERPHAPRENELFRRTSQNAGEPLRAGEWSCQPWGGLGPSPHAPVQLVDAKRTLDLPFLRPKSTEQTRIRDRNGPYTSPDTQRCYSTRVTRIAHTLPPIPANRAGEIAPRVAVFSTWGPLSIHPSLLTLVPCAWTHVVGAEVRIYCGSRAVGHLFRQWPLTIKPEPIIIPTHL